MFSKRVHCMLLVLISLTQDLEHKGVKSVDIAHQHNIPLVVVRRAVQKLFENDLILATTQGQLLLSEKVAGLTLCDFVFCFGEAAFDGTFTDTKTQSPSALSMASRVIIAEQNRLYGIVHNRLQHINLLKWCEKAGKTICI